MHKNFENGLRGSRRDGKISLDIAIPVYDEEAGIPLLISRLESTFSVENRKAEGLGKVRYIFIDDGSTDNSRSLLVKNTTISNAMRIVSFSRNFGHQAAVSAGVDMSDADVTAIIDADLQDPPELILDMLKLWREGYDVVYGKRKRRNEGMAKNLAYKFFYRLYRFLSPIEIAVDSGDFCIMGSNVVASLKSLTEKLRFQRGLRSWVGFSQVGLEYDRPSRTKGETKYTFRALYQLATDGIASISIVPLKAAQFFSLLFLVITTLVFIAIRLDLHEELEYDPVLIIAFTLLIGNTVILICLYTLAAYIGRTYLEVKNRPSYIIKDMVDVNPPGNDKDSK